MSSVSIAVRDENRVCAIRLTAADGLCEFKLSTFRGIYGYPQADFPFPQTAG